MSNAKDEVNVSKMYRNEALISKDEFIQKYNISRQRITN